MNANLAAIRALNRVWKNLRCTDSGAIGVRRHTTATRSDIQYRNLLRLRGDQNSEHFAFLVHDYGVAI